MANFPNSVPSFTAKVNGQTIDASHINSLQDEVTAIGGYANGTAPLQSSNATFAALVKLSGVLSPTALSSGDTTDYNPSGLSAASVVRLSGAAGGSTIVSLVAVSNAWVTLINVSGNTIGLKFNSGTAGNRFAFRSGNDTTLVTNDSMQLWYDPVTAFWREIG